MFGRLYELGQAGQRVASVDVPWCRDVHEHGEVALHCERFVVRVRCTLRARFEPITFLGKAVGTFRAASSMQVCE